MTALTSSPARTSLAAPVFVGRDRELAVLTGLLPGAAAAAPRVVLIEGGAGLGKSALAAEFLARCPGLPVLAAAADPAEQQLSWGVIRQLTSRADGGALAGLPLLAAGPGPADDPLAVGAELASLLAGLAAGAGLVVVVEDLQWADAASARALLYAVRRVGGQRVLVVLSARPDALAVLGESWTRFLFAGRGCTRLRLTGLDDAEIGQLARRLRGGPLSRRALRRIADYSRGNPQLAAALLAELPGPVLDGPEAGIQLPASVTAPILARLAALPAQARDLVSAASVLGGSCAVAAAAALAGVARPERVLDAAVAAGFLAIGPDTGQVRFGEELTRLAVCRDIAPARRRSLHRWAASITAGPAALAHRVVAAAGTDPQLAAELEAAAAAAAGSGLAAGTAQAASQLAQAAELGSDGPARSRRLLSALELHISAADPAGAELVRRSAGELPPGVRRDTALGHLALLRGRASEAERLFLAAWTASRACPVAGPAGDAGSAAEATGSAAAGAAGSAASGAAGSAAAGGGSAAVAGLAVAGLAVAGLAVQADDDAADPELAASAAAGLAVRYGSAGRLAECRDWVSRSVRLSSWPGQTRCLQALAMGLAGDAAGGLELLAGPGWPGGLAGPGRPAHPGGVADPGRLMAAGLADELTVRGVLRLRAGQLAGADEDLSAVTGLLADGARLRFPGLAAGYLAETEFRLGRWDDAERHASLAIELAAEAGRDADLPLAHSVAAQIAAVRGDFDRAEAEAAAAGRAARREAGAAASALAAAACGVLGFARDDPAEVLRGTAALATAAEAAGPPVAAGPHSGLDGSAHGGPDDPAASLWRPMRAWALLRSGQDQAAAAALAGLAARAARHDDDHLRVHCGWLAAASALRRDDVAQAARALRQASGAAAGLPLSLARALHELEQARCLARGRSRPAAQARLRTAHRILADLRARPLARAAQAELAALGVRDQPDPDGSFPGLSGLTAQELQVARLVAAGLSNREAAARLYLSPKTVEFHLARIFAKLGIQRRYQLAAAIMLGSAPISER
jgi:DNA-binding CsgD family transcriptional regulator